jgi:Phosphotransferase enzyme family
VSDVTEARIPESAAALTPVWLTAALGRSGGFERAPVIEVDTEPVGTGQMCDSVRLRLGYAGPTDGPATLVAKLPAADPTSRATAKALRSYETEVRFYQELAPSLPVRSAACHYADIDVESAAFVLLLEDLAPARPGDQLAGCTPDQAAIAVAELVRLHAPRWGDPSLAGIEWLHRDPEVSRAFLGQLLPGLHEGFRLRYDGQLGDDVTAACDLLFGHLDAYLIPSATPRTVIHGDYRLDNLLFGADGGGPPVAVVDWQTAAHGPGLSDVAYFIGAGLKSEDRVAHEDALVRDYHERLLAAGVEGYTWDDCWEDYRRGTGGGIVMAVAASMLVERTERGDEMFLTMARRHAEHFLDLDAPALFAT